MVAEIYRSNPEGMPEIVKRVTHEDGWVGDTYRDGLTLGQAMVTVDEGGCILTIMRREFDGGYPGIRFLGSIEIMLGETYILPILNEDGHEQEYKIVNKG